jgi:4-hydroxy-2-oxoglutarate aldolase
MNFAGIFTPIATPFDRRDVVDEGALRRNVRRWMQTPLTGIVVLGSNGEAVQLDERESDRVIAVAREEVPANRPFIAGTGRESTKATIDASRRAAAAGADAVLVRTPAFFRPQMTSGVFIEHYSRVADASPVPVLLYNVTVFTGVSIQADAVERLAQHPNIVGMKESGSDIAAIGELVSRTSDDFTLLAGSATTFLHACVAGCDGGILALASIAPDECVELQSLVQQNQLDRARELQRKLTPLARTIGGQHGLPALKAALDLIGYEGGLPRPPMLPADESIVRTLRAQLEALRGASLTARS